MSTHSTTPLLSDADIAAAAELIDRLFPPQHPTGNSAAGLVRRRARCEAAPVLTLADVSEQMGGSRQAIAAAEARALAKLTAVAELRLQRVVEGTEDLVEAFARGPATRDEVRRAVAWRERRLAGTGAPLPVSRAFVPGGSTRAGRDDGNGWQPEWSWRPRQASRALAEERAEV